MEFFKVIFRRMGTIRYSAKSYIKFMFAVSLYSIESLPSVSRLTEDDSHHACQVDSGRDAFSLDKALTSPCQQGAHCLSVSIV